jgi:hypothetical protein
MTDTAIVVTVRVTPAPGNERNARHAGALAVVFTTAKSEADAIKIAGRETVDAGWLWETLESIGRVTRASHDEGKSGLEHFEQVLLDDVVVVLHTCTHPDDGGPRH